MHTPRRPDLQSRSEQGIAKGWCSNLRFLFLDVLASEWHTSRSRVFVYIYVYAQSKLETRVSGGQHALAARKRHQEWFPYNRQTLSCSCLFCFLHMLASCFGGPQSLGSRAALCA